MARGKEPKAQFNLRLPKEVLRHLEDRYYRTGVEKQIQSLAGLVAFEWCDEAERSAIMQVATRVARGEVAWPDVVAALGRRKTATGQQKELLGLIAPYVGGGDTKRAKQRPA
ncbi:MAG TPA: hypothetical protein VM243_08460 [Phycisphaerae bacterium]|nr:hypothetical protein [Phycisphaerae bacterium]